MGGGGGVTTPKFTRRNHDADDSPTQEKAPGLTWAPLLEPLEGRMTLKTDPGGGYTGRNGTGGKLSLVSRRPDRPEKRWRDRLT